MRSRTRIGIGGVVALALLASIGAWAIGLQVVRPGVEPDQPTSAEDLYRGWNDLLGRRVHEDGVDYEGLAADGDELRRFAATLGEVGPTTRPELFTDDTARLAYYINAYNALTLLGVIEHHPIDSIHEVRGLIEPAPGFGFFWAQRFRLDGRGLNLYDLENKIIRPRFGDARIHAAINCASGSCPTLQPAAFRPEALDSQLDAVTQGFVGDDRHVRFEEGVVHLSSIFTWFAGDFEEHALQRGLPAHTLAFVEHFTLEPERRELAALARAEGWELRTMDYDWSLNRRPE